MLQNDYNYSKTTENIYYSKTDSSCSASKLNYVSIESFFMGRATSLTFILRTCEILMFFIRTCQITLYKIHYLVSSDVLDTKGYVQYNYDAGTS
jgi:hypothetical protein